ncbi:MAG TPA: hypothetical protein VGB46_06045 [Flavisolibacter sp.]|jgi:hypothetical protein
MKNILFLLLLTAAATLAQAQDDTTASAASLPQQPSYRTAVGVKLWSGAGLSVKHFGGNTNAIELIAFFGRNTSRLTGLYEIHGNAGGISGLQWYAGPGAHISFSGGRKTGKSNYVGIDGVAGLDYRFASAPISISLDIQPSYEFGGSEAFRGILGGLGIRYVW